MTIDARFIDVDLASEGKRLGFLPGQLPSPKTFSAPRYEDAQEIIPESRWREEVDRIEKENAGVERLVTRIYDQGNEGSCVANACSQAHEVTQALQFGKSNVVPLSAISLYKRIGRSPNSGAMVSDGMEEMRDRGILPLDTPENRAKYPHVMPPRGFREPFPSGWEATAASFKLHEYFIGETVEELMTAGINGHTAIIGRSGHSICYLRPTWRNNAWLYGYANSWRIDWGSAWGDLEGGFGFDSMRSIRSSAGYAVIVRSVIVPRT